MGKNQSASGLTNIVQYDNDGNISLVSGSTTLLYISSSGAITTRGIISGSNALSASYAASASNAISGAYAVNATTASYSLTGTSASYAINATTASYAVASTSASYAINATTASYAVASTSGSYAINATTASYAVASTNAANATLFNSTASSVFSTTGSNTLTGTQYVSNTNNATGFSNTTASIYTDGGLQVTKDAYFSSSMFIKGNLTVFGTQSVSFISSSQLNIGTNLITVNTDTPSIRFGGLAVYDSGSTGLTGSILWDSQNNHWVYTNPSGSSYSGGMFISGPRASSLGSEQGTTLNAIMKGMGGDHITSSAMFEVSGSVGIGTTSPTELLHVTNGYILVGIDKGIKFDTSGASGHPELSIDSGAALSFKNTAGSTSVFIKNDGSVGIGTTSPSVKLEVNGEIRLPNNTFLQAKDTSTGWIEMVKGDASNNTVIANNKSSAIVFNNDASTERMRITYTGLVGIGTTSPNGVLDISSGLRTGTTSGLFIGADSDTSVGTRTNNTRKLGLIASPHYSNTTRPVFGIAMDNQVSNNFIHIGGTYSGYNAATTITFSTGDTTTTETGTERMRITSTGNVGIGTNSPQSYTNYRILHLAGQATNGSGLLYMTNSDNSIVGMAFAEGSAQRVTFGSQTNHPVTFLTNDTERMRITSAGNVGIGSTNPGYKLDVIGGINSNSSGTGTLTLGFTGGSSRIAGRITATESPSYNSTSKLGFSITTWGANTDYGLTEVMAIDMRNADNKNPVIWMNPFGGKVGIGNTNPNNIFDIYDQTYNSNTVGVLAARTRGGGTFITGRVVTAETSNQTLTIATFSAAGTNERIFVKVQVVNVSAVNNYGNVHVGYAIWSGSGGSTVTTMTLDSGNSNISNTNVGSLSWSGNNLQYTTNRGGNYELNAITIWGSARDTGTIS